MIAQAENTHTHTYTEACVAITSLALCPGMGTESINNWAAGKLPQAPCNDDKAKELLRASRADLCVLVFILVYGQSYSCAFGCAEVKFLCVPAGEFQQHRHRGHFSRLHWTGKLRGSTCYRLNGPQHLRGAPAVGVSPRLLPQLGEGQVSRGEA